MEVTQENWGKSKLIHIKDQDTNFSVSVSSFGGTLVDVKVPDRNGNVASIIYSHSSIEDFKKQKGYIGASVGRVANRIGYAQFFLDGKKFTLFPNNDGLHCLHGGKEGFSHKEWDLIEIHNDASKNEVQVVLEYVSPDGEEGFPGQLTTRITYLISPMQVGWEFTATTNNPTIINLTNHAYWNLEGIHTLIDNHHLVLYADSFSLNDESCLPTGVLGEVGNFHLDFQNKMSLGKALEQFGDIDNNFFLKGYPLKKEKTELCLAAELISLATGRKMRVKTTEPCIQVYTGNFMDGIIAHGVRCKKHSAICLETQKVPNAINMPDFADSVILRPNQKYFHKTIHTFNIVD